MFYYLWYCRMGSPYVQGMIFFHTHHMNDSYNMSHTCAHEKIVKKLCSSVPWPVAPGPEALMALIAGMFSAISGICICIARNEMTENNFYIAMALNVLNTTILFGTPGTE